MLLAIAWAIAADWTAEESETAMLISTVLTSDVALTRVASSSGVVSSPKESMAG